jgi:protein-disulfide isomerase
MALALNSFRHRHEGIIDFSYKHFPVSAWRRHGFKAAEAAECARAQGRFWPMHDMLIANQDRLSLRHLSEYAESIGLDMGRFGREMEAGSHSPTIRSHIYRGTLAGVRRTPTYFVAGILVDPAGGLRSLFDASQHVLAQRRGAAHPVN